MSVKKQDMLTEEDRDESVVREENEEAEIAAENRAVRTATEETTRTRMSGKTAKRAPEKTPPQRRKRKRSMWSR